MSMGYKASKKHFKEHMTFKCMRSKKPFRGQSVDKVVKGLLKVHREMAELMNEVFVLFFTSENA